MSGWGSRLITVASMVSLTAPLMAAEVHGSVDCADRCSDFVVYLEGGPSHDGSGQVVEFGQKNKIFIPHVLPLLKGSTLRVGNDDPFLHNVHARKDGETVFNFNVLFQYQTVDQVVAEAGVYQISCEPHPEMSAVLVVLDNPFFAQPDKSGRFAIPRVPPGSYELVCLDAERGRRVEKRVEIGDGPVRVDFQRGDR